jgi:hypothetical protein
MTPAALRRRLRRLEQAIQEMEFSRLGNGPSNWDVISGAANWDQLNKLGQEALRKMLEGVDLEPAECPIEKAIVEGIPPLADKGSPPQTGHDTYLDTPTV